SSIRGPATLPARVLRRRFTTRYEVMSDLRVSVLLTLAFGLLVAALLASTVVGRWRPRLPRFLEPGHAAVVRVQVLNGSGEGGVASRAAAFLRDGGFLVTEIRNADRSDYFATFVVARRADVSGATAVARYLGDA